MSIRGRVKRLEREAEGALVFVPRKDGTARRFPEAALQESFVASMRRLRGEEVAPHPLGVAATAAPDPRWSRSLYSAEWVAIVAPPEDPSE